MTSIFLPLRKSQNVLNFCSHLFENQLRNISVYIFDTNWVKKNWRGLKLLNQVRG